MPYRTPSKRPKADPMRARTPEELEAFVRKMRELGVSECDGIVLGPLQVKLSEEEIRMQRAEAEQREENRHFETMFAASRIKPKIRRVK